MCQDKLMEEIEHKRREMISAAKETGFLSVQTISASQELDKLLNVVQGDQLLLTK
ncbi:aspartyl-phosphate phosphatase Spo0E family protein [Bacillus selenatarsenatis]|uniref:Aspartyl-phosphate phosphatase Spo0E family protein n=2 Tax=Bacillaceae TaxID=186817 RepID=A0A846TF04_9BACI|nr:aspartyl-phosphate phosphatase Spo0E family protein [Mesobacillus selenatarsenatis]